MKLLNPWPKQWHSMPLGELVDIRGGKPAPKTGIIKDPRRGGLPFIRMRDLGRHHITKDLRDYSDLLDPKFAESNGYSAIPRGAILIPRSGSVALNHRAILGIDAAIVSHICALIVTDPHRCLPEYLFRVLTLMDMKKMSTKTTGLDAISFAALRKVEIPLPAIKQQRRIVDLLDAADDLRTKRRESLAQLDTLLQSTFLDLFGDPVTNPKGWEVKKLGDLATRITKGQSPKWQGFGYQDQGLLFVTSENVRQGHLDISKPKFVQMEFNRKIQGSELREGDVLVNLVGASIGRSCLFEGYHGPANVNQAVGVVSLDDRMLAEYVVQLLQTQQGQRLLTGRIVEAARANISLKNLRELVIPIPHRERILEYCEFVSKLKAQRTLNEKQLAELDTLFASLQSRAFRGEL